MVPIENRTLWHAWRTVLPMNIFGTQIGRVATVLAVSFGSVAFAATPALASCVVTIRNTTTSDDRYTDTAHQIRYEINVSCGGGQADMTTKVSTSNAMIDRVGDVSPSMSGSSAAGSGVGFGAGGITSDLLPQTTYFVQATVTNNGSTYTSEIIGITTTSEEVAARNTTTTTIPPAANSSSPAESSTPSMAGGSAAGVPSMTSVQEAVEDDGVEDDYAELSVRIASERFDIRINSSFPNTEMMIRARKPGTRAIIWNITTSAEGARRILTSRNLSGYTLTLLIDDEVFYRVRVR